MKKETFSSKEKLFAATVALAGTLFAVAAGLGGANKLCLTQGCSLYKDVTFLGVSLWWWGAAGFVVMGALSLLGKLRWAYVLACAGLAIDCVFLAWMAASVPCINCLVIGLIFFSLFLTLAVTVAARHVAPLALGVAWLMLFTPNIFAAGQELAGPWSIRGDGDAPVRVFFSPSCPSCREALKGLLMNGEGNLGFYPVAEDEADVLRLATLQRELQNGAPFAKAFAASRDPKAAPDLGSSEMLALRLGLLRNKVALARMGAPKIPVILMLGVPQGFGERGMGAQGRGLNFGSGEDFSGCAQLGDGTQDCDTPEGSLTLNPQRP